MKRIWEKKEKTKQLICVIIGICAALIMTGSIAGHRMQSVDAKMEQTQQELAKEVFRFHVLANSDKDSDQQVKLLVRDAILSYMKENMKEECPDKPTAAETKSWAMKHLSDIEETAEQVLWQEGYDYGAKAEVTTCYFPDKTYGDVTFPQGNYEALRVELGKAAGHNWWCVLYPNLCFIDSTCAVVSDKGKEELEEVLTDEEYEMVTAQDNFKIKWFFFGEDPEEK